MQLALLTELNKISEKIIHQGTRNYFYRYFSIWV